MAEDQSKRMPPERQVVALAEAYIALEQVKIDIKRATDEIWLKVYGPKD